MAYTRKTWVNVPDPDSYNGDIPLSDLPRYDAQNMNRIEEGIEAALDRTVTTYIEGRSLFEINEDGLYYGTEMTDLPPGNSLHTGFIRVIVRNENYKVVYWRPYNSSVEYSNVKVDGVWRGWVETFTNQGGIIDGYLATRSSRAPGIHFLANKSFAQIVKNASDDIDLGVLISDFADIQDGDSSANLILSHSKARTLLRDALQFAHVKNGVAEYFNIYGKHNKPSGTYSGTYNSGSGNNPYNPGGQIIDIKGDSYVVLVVETGGDTIAVVTQYGAFIWRPITTGTTYTKAVTYSNGQLTIPQEYSYLDMSGKMYDWYCL